MPSARTSRSTPTEYDSGTKSAVRPDGMTAKPPTQKPYAS
jgi:hypothetical protein